MIAEFLIYEGKVAVLMAVFYLFYRLLLSRETLHAVNRVVLIATAVSSFILPIIHLTRYRTVAYPDITLEAGEGAIDPIALTEMAGESPWILFLFGVFILGAFIIITRIAFAIVKVRRILSKGRPIILEDGTEMVVSGEHRVEDMQKLQEYINNGYDISSEMSRAAQLLDDEMTYEI